MTERISKAIDVFLDALNNGTLAKGTCTACAVGNLVAAGMNGTIIKKRLSNGLHVYSCDKPNGFWGSLFVTDMGEQTVHDHNLYASNIQENIKATDFTWEELAKIEFAFETNTRLGYTQYEVHTPREIRADQVKGLEAVIKVMMEFDEVKEDVKEVFTSKAELIPVLN